MTICIDFEDLKKLVVYTLLVYKLSIRRRNFSEVLTELNGIEEILSVVLTCGNSNK